MKSIFRMLITGCLSFVAIGLLVFLPAGTLNYWQGWVFLAVVAIAGWVLNLYFLRTNPVVLDDVFRWPKPGRCSGS